MDTPNRQLNDEELESVGGGVSSDAIIKAINEGWKCVPQQIRELIIKTYTNLGKNAAKKLVLDLAAGNLEYMKKMANLFN